jgi:hypothetical protein
VSPPNFYWRVSILPRERNWARAGEFGHGPGIFSPLTKVAPAQLVETCRALGEEEEEPGALQIGDTDGIIPQFVVTRRRRDRRADVDIRREGTVGSAAPRAAGSINLVGGENG